MAEILKEWLSQILERPIYWEAEEFGTMMKNGHVIATVLRCYHVINEEKHFLIRPSNEKEDIKSNWKFLAEWLKDVEVHLSEGDIYNVMDGRGSSLLRLFYQLFLHLDRRDRTNFIKREQKMVSSLVDKMKSRFKIDKVSEHRETVVDELSKPLLDERQFIEWQKQKAEQVKESYDFLRHKYSKKITMIEESKIAGIYGKKLFRSCEKEKKEIEKFDKKYPCKFQNYTYEELSKLEENAIQRTKNLIDSEWTTEYLNNISQRIRKRTGSEEFQRQMGRTLSNSLWNACVTEEENKVDMELAKKVMKLSQFEKQMCTQIMETKQQARNLTKNRIQGEKEYAEQREQQLNIFFDNLREKITSGTLEIDFEKMRQNELHRKLYAEKMSRKRQIYYEICYETITALVDYAVKFGYFKKLLEDDVPAHFIHEWKNLFFKQQPIFDVFRPTEEILKKEEQSPSLKMEEVTIESDRQEVLNKCELEDYLDYLYSWNLEHLIPNYDPDAEERKFEKLGMHILGHVIYTLLELKYPYPTTRFPAELPEFSVKGLLRGLPDKSLTQAIQVLLNYRKIHVVRLETVINYCLRQYKLEMVGHTEIDLEYDNFIAVAQEEESKEFIKSMKSDEEILAKSRENNASDLLVSTLPNTKQTQTPKSLPEDEMTMSIAASLGNYAFDALTVGESLTDYLLAAMIIEYLKNKNGINGFVIMNYPNNYRQAQILEEFFSGDGPPDSEELNDTDDDLLEESIIKHRKRQIDPYKEFRVSSLVQNPHIRRAEKPFKTYFTSYINLKQTSDINQELAIWEQTQENSDFADRFYAVMGINYSIYYEIINKELLAQICTYIIGDFSFPLKRDDELFGERILSELDFPISDTRRINSKIVKPDVLNGKSKDKMRRKSKTSKSTMEMDLEVIKAPHSYGEVPQNPIKTLESMIAHENKSMSSIRIETVKVLAGDEDWKYGELNIPEAIGTSIITYWEEFEKSYLQKIRQLFFSKRLQLNYVVSYTRFLKDKMNQVIKLPSHKQVLVNEFQNEYNNFEKDWRPVNVSKNEWHCRVKELQNKLYKICDERKVFAEQKRHALICDNWIIDELSILANTYISLMQMELNRSILTYQLFHDFYYTMLKGFIPSDRLSSKDLTKVSRECDNSPSGKKGDDKFYKQLKAVFQYLFLKNIELDYGNNPFVIVVDNNVKFAMKLIKDLCDSYRSLIGKDYNEKGNITTTKKKNGNNSTESSNHEEILRQNTNKCFEEWSMGINGEMFRFNLHLLALQYKCFSDMKLFSDQLLRTFTEIQNEVNAHYSNEILSVDRLCKYIHLAIENGTPIPETLLLENDIFIIDPNVCQFVPSVIPTDQENKREDVGHYEFRTSQLARLRSQFKMIAPTGLILHKAFIYLLQDFIMFGKESKEGCLFPKAWKNIDPNQVQKLVHGLFGETAYVDWRDFLIYCLQIPFPSVEELLIIRKKFRCRDLDSKEVISRNDFINEKLWFDSSFEDPLRLNLIKHFLFELFEIDENLMNYSAFLLAFCKNSNPIKGFVAALSMAVGNNICFTKDECGEIVKKLIKAKKYRDERLACAMKCTKQFIDKLIQNVIVTCLGTTVEELKYVETITEDKKSKKGKGGKGKKVDTTQSVRSTISQKNLTTSEATEKVRNVASKSKIEIAYPPCQTAPIAKEVYVESSKKRETLETKATSQDLNLTYSVDTSVIWKVLKICLPWHFQLYPEIKESPYLNLVQDIIQCLETETDDKEIYVCNLVAHPKFCKFLHKVKKFNAVNLSEEISLII